MTRPSRPRWCLLIHSLPTRPLYLRARVRRLLAESGAAPIRKAVYALPASPAALDTLQGIAAEIERGGGSAFVCEATFPDEATERSVRRASNQERQRQYRAWTAAADRELAAGARPGDRRSRLRARLDAIRALDRFAAPGRAAAEARLARLSVGARRAGSLAGRVWVTRRGIHVDRIACAWLVRRFADSEARFRFTATPDAALAAGEIGFDMPGAEVSHEDGGCSAETLQRRLRLTDPAVRHIVEIVHDIDLKDGRFGHSETAGFEQMLLGLLASHARDEDRLARGLDLFDALYAALASAATLEPRRPAPRVAIPAALRRREPRR